MITEFINVALFDNIYPKLCNILIDGKAVYSIIRIRKSDLKKLKGIIDDYRTTFGPSPGSLAFNIENFYQVLRDKNFLFYQEMPRIDAWVCFQEER
jgi:hypothetical protein